MTSPPYVLHICSNTEACRYLFYVYGRYRCNELRHCVVLVASCPRRRRAPRLDEFIVQWVPGSGQFAAAIAVVLAKSHYTCPNGPDPTRPDRTRSDKVRGLCLIGSGRVRLVEFSYLPTGICAGSTVVLRQTCCSWAAGHLLDTWVYHR